jgi:hypothetical protein
MSGRNLSDSCFSHIVNASIERVNIADWLSHLTSAEYRRCCPPAHIAAGATRSDDGRPMSITVELIGEALLIQEYVDEVTDPRYCRMVSTPDVFAPEGRTTWHVVWELRVEPLDAASCEYVNRLTVLATEDFLALLDVHGIPFPEAAAVHDRAATLHNEQETPLLALSIERHALRAGEG